MYRPKFLKWLCLSASIIGILLGLWPVLGWGLFASQGYEVYGITLGFTWPILLVSILGIGASMAIYDYPKLSGVLQLIIGILWIFPGFLYLLMLIFPIPAPIFIVSGILTLIFSEKIKRSKATFRRAN